MKTLLLIFITIYALQFASCKTSSQAFVTPQYPRNAELHSGNYGRGMYSNSNAITQEKIRMYYVFCDTAKIDGRRQVAPATPIASANVVASISPVTN